MRTARRVRRKKHAAFVRTRAKRRNVRSRGRTARTRDRNARTRARKARSRSRITKGGDGKKLLRGWGGPETLPMDQLASTSGVELRNAQKELEECRLNLKEAISEIKENYQTSVSTIAGQTEQLRVVAEEKAKLVKQMKSVSTEADRLRQHVRQQVLDENNAKNVAAAAPPRKLGLSSIFGRLRGKPKKSLLEPPQSDMQFYNDRWRTDG
jgi:hypothetical protein